MFGPDGTQAQPECEQWQGAQGAAIDRTEPVVFVAGAASAHVRGAEIVAGVGCREYGLSVETPKEDLGVSLQIRLGEPIGVEAPEVRLTGVVSDGLGEPRGDDAGGAPAVGELIGIDQQDVSYLAGVFENHLPVTEGDAEYF